MLARYTRPPTCGELAMPNPTPLRDRMKAVNDRQVFFVGGPAKSGTTWLQHLLNAHPAVACRGEGHLIRSLLPLVKGALETHNRKIETYNRGLFGETAGFPLFGQAELQVVVQSAVQVLLARVLDDKPDAQAIGEKTPANMESFPLLSWAMPGARLLCTVRDPRDCFSSNWHQTLRVNPRYIETEHGGSMARFARTYGRRWATNVAAGMKAAEAQPRAVRIVRYEDLHRTPQTVLPPLLSCLGVADDEAHVTACIEGASFSRLSGGRKRGEESRGSFFRKGVVGDWRTTLDAPAAAALVDEAGPWMQHFDYGA